MRVTPSRRLLVVLAAIGVAALGALIAGVAQPSVAAATTAAVGVLLAGTALDYTLTRRAWRAASVRMNRRLPPAFAIGVGRSVRIRLEQDGRRAWLCEL